MEKKKLSSEERLMAYLDGELSPAEAAKVEAALAGNSRAAQLYEELRAMQGSLQGLPRHALEPDFADQVVRAAQERAMSVESTSDDDGDSGEVLPLETLPLSSRPADARRGKTALIWLSMAAAAMLAAIIFFPASENSDVALNSDAQPAADERQVADADLAAEPLAEEAADLGLRSHGEPEMTAGYIQNERKWAADGVAGEELQKRRAVPADEADFGADLKGRATNANRALDKQNLLRQNQRRDENQPPRERATAASTDGSKARSAKPGRSVGPRAPAAPPAAKAFRGAAAAAGGAPGAAAPANVDRNALTPRPVPSSAAVPAVPAEQRTPNRKIDGSRANRSPGEPAADVAKTEKSGGNDRRLKELKESQQSLQLQRGQFKKATDKLVTTQSKAAELTQTLAAQAAANDQVLVVELTVPRQDWENGVFDALLANQAVVWTNNVQDAVVVDGTTEKAKQYRGEAKGEGSLAEDSLAKADAEADTAVDPSAHDAVYLETTSQQLNAILAELKNRPESFLAVQPIQATNLRLASEAVRKSPAATAPGKAGFVEGGAGGAAPNLAGGKNARSRRIMSLNQVAQQQAGRAQRVRVVEPADMLKRAANGSPSVAKEAEKLADKLQDAKDDQARPQAPALAQIGNATGDKQNLNVEQAEREVANEARRQQDQKAQALQPQRVLFVFRLLEPGEEVEAASKQPANDK